MRLTTSCRIVGVLTFSFGMLLLVRAEQAETKSALEADPKGWIELLQDKELKEWKRVPIPPGGKLKDYNPWKLDEKEKVLVCEGDKGGHEMLLYDKELADGIFHVEWRFKKIEDKKGYNSGVYARNSADGKLWHQAQVGSKNVGNFFGKTLAGGVEKGFSSSNKGPQRGKEAGEWNVYEITCKGKELTLWVNGGVTAEWKDCEVLKGYIGMEAEGWWIEFKNVKWKELTAK